MAGVVVAALVMAPVLQLLHDTYVIGSRELAAPQASLFASLARGFFGNEVLPWGLVALGAGLGGAVLALDLVLEKRGAGFRLHLMPIAVGLYLPFGLAVPIFAGGLVEWFGRRASQRAEYVGANRGVLFASGVVAGEALVGVGVALLIGLGWSGGEFGAAWLGSGLGAVSLLAALAVLVFFVFGTRGERAQR